MKDRAYAFIFYYEPDLFGKHDLFLDVRMPDDTIQSFGVDVVNPGKNQEYVLTPFLKNGSGPVIGIAKNSEDILRIVKQASQSTSQVSPNSQFNPNLYNKSPSFQENYKEHFTFDKSFKNLENRLEYSFNIRPSSGNLYNMSIDIKYPHGAIRTFDFIARKDGTIEALPSPSSGIPKHIISKNWEEFEKKVLHDCLQIPLENLSSKDQIFRNAYGIVEKQKNTSSTETARAEEIPSSQETTKPQKK